MAYLRPSSTDGIGFLGCGPACACKGRCGLGETYVRDEEESGASGSLGWFGYGQAPARLSPRRPRARRVSTAGPVAPQAEVARLQVAIAGGMRDENRLTDMLFNARHPELRGRRILPGEVVLAQEWRTLREGVVRPALARAAPSAPAAATAASAAPGIQPGASCAKEDPFPDSVHHAGTPCAPDGRKCWPAEAWLDIIDADLPCNSEEQRSPAAYSAVLDYFNVAHPRNLRYARTPGTTYCNIYVHDVTRSMRASIPHWVRDSTGRRFELNANATFDWLVQNGAAAGWMRIDPALIDWVNQQFNRRQSLPFAGGALPGAIARAGNRIAAISHANPALLRQDSYLAQQFANLGLPTIIAAKNPSGPGHVAMVRPETAALRGVLHPSGTFLPRSAQAGASNWENQPAGWILIPMARGRLFYVHA